MQGRRRPAQPQQHHRLHLGGLGRSIGERGASEEVSKVGWSKDRLREERFRRSIGGRAVSEEISGIGWSKGEMRYHTSSPSILFEKVVITPFQNSPPTNKKP